MSFTSAARIAIALLAFGSALWGIWWLTVLAMLLLSMRFSSWEVPLLGLLADFAWLPFGSPFLYPPIFTITALAVVWFFEPMRSQFLLAE